MNARRPTLALLLAAVAVAGCGSSTEESSNAAGGDNELASSDAARVLEAKRAIDAQCGDGGGATNLTAIASAVSTLITITSSSADRVYETGNVARAQAMTTVAKNTAAQLRACGRADQADRLITVARN